MVEADIAHGPQRRRPVLRLLRFGCKTGLTMAATLLVTQHADSIREEAQKWR